MSFIVGEVRPDGLLRGRSGIRLLGQATLGADYFPSAAEPPLHREAK